MLLALIAWIAIGVLIGYAATWFVDLRGDDIRLGIAVAAGASLIGGLAHVLITSTPVVLQNYWAHVVVAVAAIIAAVVWHLRRGRGTYERPSVRRSY